MPPSANPLVERELSLAMQSFRAGDVSSAMRRVDRLLPSHAGRHDVLVAKGVLLVAGGELKEGLGVLTRSLALKGDVPEALSWAAHAALGTQQFALAEELSRRFTQIDPQNAHAHHLLARSLAGTGRLAEALGAVEMALAIKPNDPGALATQAHLLKSTGMPGLAADVLRHLISLHPDPRAAVVLAQILLEESRFEEAVTVLERSLPMIPEAQRPYDLIAQAQTELRRFEQAEESWALAERLGRDRTGILQRRAIAETAVGRFEIAESILQDLLRQEEGAGQSFYQLTTTRKMRADDAPLVSRMETLLGSGQLDPVEASGLAFALGKTFDDLRDFEKAIGYFDRANEICYGLYLARTPLAGGVASARRFTEARIEYFSESRLKELRCQGNPSDFPILVMGMIRSGTTLTASIVSSHSQVAGGHENSFWRERSVLIERWDHGEFSLDLELANRFVGDYLNLLRASGSERYVVDKTPANIHYAALLNGLLPSVKMLHLLRQPVDNALSIWTTRLDYAGSFTSDRRNLVESYREHYRSLRHLQRVIPPDRLMTVSYEKLTSAPESSIDRILDFLELEHEDACYHPESTARTVLTPSVHQVRQPINTGSQQRWKNYEPWLGVFEELFEIESAE